MYLIQRLAELQAPGARRREAGGMRCAAAGRGWLCMVAYIMMSVNIIV